MQSSAFEAYGVHDLKCVPFFPMMQFVPSWAEAIKGEEEKHQAKKLRFPGVFDLVTFCRSVPYSACYYQIW